MAKKPPRRTAELILEVALAQFNRFGEPNVSTTVIAAALSISPGNLHYHYPAKEQLINALFDRYAAELNTLLRASDGVRDVEDAWFFMHTLFELIWRYRFLYRDLNDLLSKNRWLETQFQTLLISKTRAVQTLLGGLRRAGALTPALHDLDATATTMVVLLTYWLDFEYVRDPRHALEPAHAEAALLRGAQHTLQVLAPYLEDSQRLHLAALVASYRDADQAASRETR